MVVVDDAEQLPAEQLRYLTDNAAATNTKLLLITNPDDCEPAYTLTAVLVENLPWAQQLGASSQSQRRQQATTLARAEQHLATASTQDAHHAEAAELLRRRDQLIDHHRHLAGTENLRDLGRGRIRDRGLEL
jgi:hypothetical protein